MHPASLYARLQRWIIEMMALLISIKIDALDVNHVCKPAHMMPYIDPETHTAAKCNYCASRIDVGLEPACVNVCPEHAIISGDMENPETEIAQLLARQATKVRKPEKGTNPNLFYIDADDVSLIPSATNQSEVSLWGSQALGVGHFAKEAEKLAFSNGDVLTELINLNGGYTTDNDQKVKAPKSIEKVICLLYTSPSPRDQRGSRMPSSA